MSLDDEKFMAVAGTAGALAHGVRRAVREGDAEGKAAGAPRLGGALGPLGDRRQPALNAPHLNPLQGLVT